MIGRSCVQEALATVVAGCGSGGEDDAVVLVGFIGRKAPSEQTSLRWDHDGVRFNVTDDD